MCILVPLVERSVFWAITVLVNLCKNCTRACVLFGSFAETELLHCTDEQHATCSGELQSGLMIATEFEENYYAV
jgi:hypothetical protein